MKESNDEILFPVNYSARKIRCIVEEINPDIYVQAVEIYRSDDKLYIYLTLNEREIVMSKLLMSDDLDSELKQLLESLSSNT